MSHCHTFSRCLVLPGMTEVTGLGISPEHRGWHTQGGRPAMNTRPPESEPLLTPAEVAAMFRVDPKTVTRWAKAGKLSSIRTPGGHRRYRESEVRDLLPGMLPEQRRSNED